MMSKKAVVFLVASIAMGTYMHHYTPALSFRRQLLQQSLDEMPKDAVEKWNPVNCSDLLEQAYRSEIYDPNENTLLARWTKTNPPFFIALSKWWYDRMRKSIFDEGEYYERYLSEVFGKILRDAPANARVVDVGGNIGWFTLTSAANGHHVDVFEPNKVNIVRQCQSMWLNGWSGASESDVLSREVKKGSVNIHPYGVGANTTVMTLYMGKNPGQATLNRDMIPRKRTPLSATINIVTLDSLAEDQGWFKSKAPIAILKVDVEGSEPAVFAGAKQLLRAGLAENILMEITVHSVQSNLDNTPNVECLQTIVESGYYLHRTGGTSGPTGSNDFASIENLPQHIVSTNTFEGRANTVNLWWKKGKPLLEV